MKTKELQNTKLTKRNGLLTLSAIIALFTITAFLTPTILVQAASPAAGSLSPTSGTSVIWNGTSPGGASPEGETTCVENVNCETYTLSLSGTPADWNGKVVKVSLDWLAPATDYDLYIRKDSVTGPEVTRSAQGPTINESAEIDPTVSRSAG